MVTMCTRAYDFYNSLRTSDLGSKSHVTHFATWYSTTLTLIFLTVPFTYLVTLGVVNYLYDKTIEWNSINIAQYLWAWTIWIVLTGVMTRYDWTPLGTFFELLHNCMECLLTFTCCDNTFAGVIFACASFALQLIPIVRSPMDSQYTWAVIIGSVSHYVNLIPLSYVAVHHPKLIILPIAMAIHFTYDFIYLILSNLTSFCMGPPTYDKQVWLPFFNSLAVVIICANIQTYKSD